MQDTTYPDLIINIIALWYVGGWGQGFDQVVVSADGYREGLVWDAIGAHPMGAKQPGFDTWSEPPPPFRDISL